MLHSFMGAASQQTSMGAASQQTSMSVASLHKLLGPVSLDNSMGATLLPCLWVLYDCTSQWVLHPCTSKWVLHSCTRHWVRHPCTSQWVSADVNWCNIPPLRPQRRHNSRSPARRRGAWRMRCGLDLRADAARGDPGIRHTHPHPSPFRLLPSSNHSNRWMRLGFQWASLRPRERPVVAHFCRETDCLVPPRISRFSRLSQTRLRDSPHQLLRPDPGVPFYM